MKKIIYIAFAFMLTLGVQAQVDRSKQPQPGPSPSINIGKPKEFTLPNGLNVMVVENHKLPRVNFILALDNPPVAEGRLKGVSNLASSMMGNGTSKISKDDFNKQLDFYGASVSFSVDYIGGNTLSKYFPEVFKLAAQGALDPLFTPEEFDSEKSKLLDGIKIEEKSTSAIANRVRRVLLYGKDHPKGEYLSKETIDNVTLDDAKNYYKENFVPANAYLIVLGDVKFENVKKLATESFSVWKKASAPKNNYADPDNVAQTEIDFVDVPNAVQSEISMSNIVNLKMNDSDYFATLLANRILGGGAESYLFMNLREKHGWTYGAYSSVSGDKYPTNFTASAAVRNAVTDSAVVEMMQEVKRIGAEGIGNSLDELKLAKASYTGSFVMNAEKPSSVAGFALSIKTQNLPSDFYTDYLKKLNAVTPEQIQAAASKYFLPNCARIVVAGKASEVLPGLEKIGLPINYFDKYGNSVSKPEEKKVDADVTVSSVLNKYINAIGGKAALEKIKTIKYVAKANIQGQEITLVRKETATGKTFQEMSLADMPMMKLAFNGKKGYSEMQMKRTEMTPDDLAELKYAAIFPELNMLNSQTISLSGIEQMNGKDAYKLTDGKLSFFYDVDSGLKVAESTKKEASPGNVLEQMTTYSDYKETDGIQFPFKSTINIGAEIVLNVEDIKINQDVSDRDFE